MCQVGHYQEQFTQSKCADLHLTNTDVEYGRSTNRSYQRNQQTQDARAKVNAKSCLK